MMTYVRAVILPAQIGPRRRFACSRGPQKGLRVTITYLSDSPFGGGRNSVDFRIFALHCVGPRARTTMVDV